jgi:hypothetical protein
MFVTVTCTLCLIKILHAVLAKDLNAAGQCVWAISRHSTVYHQSICIAQRIRCRPNSGRARLLYSPYGLHMAFMWPPYGLYMASMWPPYTCAGLWWASRVCQAAARQRQQRRLPPESIIVSERTLMPAQPFLCPWTVWPFALTIIQ